MTTTRRPTSAARAAASRLNGARSRGPRTAAGKARSARNALEHGLRSGSMALLAGEDPGAFDALGRALAEELDPWGPLQAGAAARTVTTPSAALPPPPTTERTREVTA